jgi:hypothetical protein
MVQDVQICILSLMCLPESTDAILAVGGCWLGWLTLDLSVEKSEGLWGD